MNLDRSVQLHGTRAALLVGSCVLASSCESPSQSTAHLLSRHGLEDFAVAAGGPDLALALFPERDTVVVGEPVVLFVAVRNTGDPRRFYNDPALFFFHVLKPDGKEVAMSVRLPEPPRLGDVPEITLGRGSLIGNRVDLLCGRSWFASSSDRAPCGWTFELRESGTYRVVASYSAPPPPRESGAPGAMTLSSDTARVHVRIP